MRGLLISFATLFALTGVAFGQGSDAAESLGTMSAAHNQITALDCSLIAAIVWAVAFVVARWSRIGMLPNAVAGSLKTVAATFFFVGLLYVGLGHWVEALGPGAETTKAVREIETTISELKSFILPFFSMGDWTKLALLLALVVISVFGGVQSAGLMFTGLSRYAKLSARLFVVLTALVSFSFFQAQFNEHADAQVALLRVSLDEMSGSAAALQREAEEAAIDIVIDELIDQPSIATRITKAATLLDFHTEWMTSEERSRSILLEKLPKSTAETRAAFFDSEIAAFEKARLTLAQLSDRERGMRAGSPTDVELAPTDSAARFKTQRDVVSNIRESIVSDGRKRVSENEEIVRDMVRHAYKMGYKASVGPEFERIILVDLEGIPEEIVKLVLDPAVLNPVRDVVIDATRKLLSEVGRRVGLMSPQTAKTETLTANATSAMALEIRTELNKRVKAKVVTLKWDDLDRKGKVIDLALEGALDHGRAVQGDIIERETRAAAETVPDLREQAVVMFRNRLSRMQNEDLRAAAEGIMDRVFVLIDAKTEGDNLERLLHYRTLQAQVSEVDNRTNSEKVNAIKQLESEYLGTSEFETLLERHVANVLDGDRYTRWGEVRSIVTEALDTGQLNLEPANIREWKKIWARWQSKEHEIALRLVLNGNSMMSPKPEVFDGPFRELLSKDHRLAAIWGFSAKSFIDPKAEEGYYREQFRDYDTLAKVRKKINFVTYYAVMVPAIEDGVAHSDEDAIRKLANGQLDKYIIFEKIEQIIRERGMIPRFGLDYYLKTSIGSAAELSTATVLERITGSDTWSDTIDRYCK